MKSLNTQSGYKHTDKNTRQGIIGHHTRMFISNDRFTSKQPPASYQPRPNNMPKVTGLFHKFKRTKYLSLQYNQDLRQKQ